MKKIRPDLAGMETLELLGKLGGEALRLREENKKLAAELKAAKKRLVSLEKRGKPARSAPVVTEREEVKVSEKKPATKRQALGVGLARFLGERKQT